mmetsp:Transcript_44122/g.138635  ORF Transcript_44122/g.138635 Transcript_44122/m.138635 type:complete len:259 (+) Transcript_44122:273-1049(+)
MLTAPASSSIATMSTGPWRAAKVRAVLPDPDAIRLSAWSQMFTSVPARMSNRAASTLSSSASRSRGSGVRVKGSYCCVAAQHSMSGVRPNLFMRFTSTLCGSSSLTMCGRKCMAAWCRTVFPSRSAKFGAAPNSQRNSTISVRFRCAASMSAVVPVVSAWSMSAPASRSSSATSSPRTASASMSAERPRRSAAWILAPKSRSRRVMPTDLLAAAQMSGVPPEKSARFTSAPLSRSSRTTPTWPALQASSSAVLPSSSW